MQMSRMIKQPILFPSENCYSVDDGNDSVLEVVFYIYIYYFLEMVEIFGNRWWMADVVASMVMVITVIVLQQRSRPCYS
jgi:hypothetical protein